jgi:hypothetical protein
VYGRGFRRSFETESVCTTLSAQHVVLAKTGFDGLEAIALDRAADRAAVHRARDRCSSISCCCRTSRNDVRVPKPARNV